jgi:hypothetical protein
MQPPGRSRGSVRFSAATSLIAGTGGRLGGVTSASASTSAARRWFSCSIAQFVFERSDPLIPFGHVVPDTTSLAGELVGKLADLALRQPQLLGALPVEAAHEVGQHVDLAERMGFQPLRNAPD